MSQRYSKFLTEVSRCDYSPLQECSLNDFLYNGITYAQSTETYRKVLSPLLNDFKAYLGEVQNKVVLHTILTELKTVQSSNIDYIPTNEAIEGMRLDYLNNPNQSIKNDLDKAVFIREMTELQQYYVREAMDYVSLLLGEERPIEQSNVKEVIVEVKKEKAEVKENKTASRYLEGIKGLMQYLNIGKSKAAEISTSKLLYDEKIRIKVGKAVRFDRQKLDDLLRENPDAFAGKMDSYIA